MEKTIKSYKNGITFEIVACYEPLRQWCASDEPETGNWMVDHVKPDWTVIDAGADVGVYTMLLSCLALQGQVYAFEPGEKTRKMLASNLAHNQNKDGCKFTNIHIEPLALGDRSGRSLPETLWLTDGTAQYGKTDGEFNFVTLDDFCLTHNMVSRCDFIKCDVDGWDYEVLLGARKTIEKYRPYIIVEVNYALSWRKHNYKEVDQLLFELNYQHKVIDPTPGNWLCWPNEKAGG